MEYLLLFLAVLLVGGTAFLLVGSTRRGPEASRGGARELPGELVGLVEPVPALPPVLLPERPRAGDVERLRLGVGLRGYRGDQVDEVLDVLAAEIERLHVELEEARRKAVISATNHSPE